MTKLFASGETLTRNPQKDIQFGNEGINVVYLNDKATISMCVYRSIHTRDKSEKITGQKPRTGNSKY